MRRLIDLKIVVVVFAFTFFSCEKLKPESVNVPDYPNMEEVYTQQVELLSSKKLSKEVFLDGKSESKLLEMDTTGWKKELSFLKEINPNTPEYVGAFEKSERDDFIQLSLMLDEKGELRMLSYSMQGKNYSIIRATIHEDKEVYSHHRDFDLTFKNGLLKSYEITGYQKIVFKDTIRFRIVGEVGIE